MTEHTQVDLTSVRRFAGQLREAATDLRDQRPDLLSRLASGAKQRPVLKTRDNVMVTIGAAPFTHSGSQAGELIAQRLKSCGDGYQAVEDGIRAMATVMSKMADALETNDTLNQEALDGILADLYCVVLVVNGQAPQGNDWFGMEDR